MGEEETPRETVLWGRPAAAPIGRAPPRTGLCALGWDGGGTGTNADTVVVCKWPEDMPSASPSGHPHGRL